MSTPIAKTQPTKRATALTELSPAERMAKLLAPRKLTAFDRCLAATTTSRLQPAKGWVRTV